MYRLCLGKGQKGKGKFKMRIKYYKYEGNEA